MGRKTNKPKLAADLRLLRAQCTPYLDRASTLLDTFYQRVTVPELPPLEMVFEPNLDEHLVQYLTSPGNRCPHAHGGDERTPNEPECTWCDTKDMADEGPTVRVWNAQIRHFRNRILAVRTARTNHFHDEDRAFSPCVLRAYGAMEDVMTRAAKSWILTHPPPPDYAGIMATQGYWEFCPSRLCHVKCGNPQCFDCHAYVWYVYINDVLEYVTRIASFEARLGGLGKSWGSDVSLETNVEVHSKRRCFSHVGTRKRKVMNDFLAWAKATRAPNYDDLTVRLRVGPGTGDEDFQVHPWCEFFNCIDEYCNGLH